MGISAVEDDDDDDAEEPTYICLGGPVISIIAAVSEAAVAACRENEECGSKTSASGSIELIVIVTSRAFVKLHQL